MSVSTYKPTFLAIRLFIISCLVVMPRVVCRICLVQQEGSRRLLRPGLPAWEYARRMGNVVEDRDPYCDRCRRLAERDLRENPNENGKSIGHGVTTGTW